MDSTALNAALDCETGVPGVILVHEKTKQQRGHTTDPRSHDQLVAELGFQLN